MGENYLTLARKDKSDQHLGKKCNEDNSGHDDGFVLAAVVIFIGEQLHVPPMSSLSPFPSSSGTRRVPGLTIPKRNRVFVLSKATALPASSAHRPASSYGLLLCGLY
jgi:hypothetical protein